MSVSGKVTFFMTFILTDYMHQLVKYFWEEIKIINS